VSGSQRVSASGPSLLWSRRHICRTRHHASQIVGQDRRRPHRLDVLHNQLRAACVANERSRPWIVHCVCEVSSQYDVEAKARHLSCAEPAVQDTDVRMDPHQHDLVYALLLTEVVYLLAAIAHSVEAHNVNCRVFAGPRVGRNRRWGNRALRPERAGSDR